MVGDRSGSAPAGAQGALWDLLPIAEQDRIGALFEASLPEDEPLDVLPGERAYERWKAA